MKISRLLLHLVLLLSLIVLVGLVFRRPLYSGVSDIKSLGFLMLLWLIPSITLFGLKESFSYFREAFLPPAQRTAAKEAINYFKILSIYVLLGSVVISGATACFWFMDLTDMYALGPFLTVMIITPLYAILSVITIFLPLLAELNRSE